MMKSRYDGEVHGTIFLSGRVGGTYGYPSIGDTQVAGLLSVFSGETVYVRYAFDNEPIDRESFLCLAIDAVEGETRAQCDFSPGYSEVTPAYYSEDARVGGHDMLTIFASTRKCYSAILVSTNPIADLAEALGLYD